VGVYPKDDTFQEFATHYGERLASYIRHRPWATDNDTTTTGYDIANTVGDPHGGYSTSYRVVSFKSQSDTGATASMGAVLWRQAYLTDCKASLTFRSLLVSGTQHPTAIYYDFRFAAVCVRRHHRPAVDLRHERLLDGSRKQPSARRQPEVEVAAASRQLREHHGSRHEGRVRRS